MDRMNWLEPSLEQAVNASFQKSEQEHDAHLSEFLDQLRSAISSDATSCLASIENSFYNCLFVFANDSYRQGFKEGCTIHGTIMGQRAVI